MTKVKIITGFSDSYPPKGAIGKTVKFSDGNIGFVPDSLEHYPPDESPEDFEGYVVDVSELVVMEG